jgi:hypothetical protein
MIGFSRGQELALDQLLRRRPAPAVHWRVGRLQDADAWWANGARTQVLGDGSLRVAPGEPGGGAVRLSLLEVNRPLAFAEPLAHPDFEPALSFRFTDRASIHSLLDVMQTRWLAATAARLWLAARLAATQHELTHPVYHVASRGRLLAVIDRSGDVGIAPGLTVPDMEDASWVPRPLAARFFPPSFHRTTIAELVRSHALRVLPAKPSTSRKALGEVCP